MIYFSIKKENFIFKLFDVIPFSYIGIGNALREYKSIYDHHQESIQDISANTNIFKSQPALKREMKALTPVLQKYLDLIRDTDKSQKKFIKRSDYQFIANNKTLIHAINLYREIMVRLNIYRAVIDDKPWIATHLYEVENYLQRIFFIVNGMSIYDYQSKYSNVLLVQQTVLRGRNGTSQISNY